MLIDSSSNGNVGAFDGVLEISGTIGDCDDDGISKGGIVAPIGDVPSNPGTGFISRFLFSEFLHSVPDLEDGALGLVGGQHGHGKPKIMNEFCTLIFLMGEGAWHLKFLSNFRVKGCSSENLV